MILMSQIESNFVVNLPKGVRLRTVNVESRDFVWVTELSLRHFSVVKKDKKGLCPKLSLLLPPVALLAGHPRDHLSSADPMTSPPRLCVLYSRRYPSSIQALYRILCLAAVNRLESPVSTWHVLWLSWQVCQMSRESQSTATALPRCRPFAWLSTPSRPVKGISS